MFVDIESDSEAVAELVTPPDEPGRDSEVLNERARQTRVDLKREGFHELFYAHRCVSPGA